MRTMRHEFKFDNAKFTREEKELVYAVIMRITGGLSTVGDGDTGTCTLSFSTDAQDLFNRVEMVLTMLSARDPKVTVTSSLGR